MRLFDEQVRFIEVHPTNECRDCNCGWCTYRNADRSLHLPFECLDSLAALHPEEILLAGGGEVCDYEDGGRTLNDFILRLRELLPSVRIRMVTNGTKMPAGRWPAELCEVSISLDAANARQYSAYKGSQKFSVVLRNIARYLTKTAILKVRVTMIYDRARLGGAIALAERLRKLLRKLQRSKRLSSTRAEAFRFMLFPQADDSSPDHPYEATQLTPSDKARWLSRMNEIRNKRPSLSKFIDEHTNVATQPLANLVTPPVKRCPSVTDYVLLAADGNYYPCFASCAEFQEASLGPGNQSPSSLLKKRDQIFRNPPARCRKGCRPGCTFYGRRAFERFLQTFRQQVTDAWDSMVNRGLVQKAQQIGFDELSRREDLSQAGGVVWLADCVEYKVLDGHGGPKTVPGPNVPEEGQYVLQINPGRSVTWSRPDKFDPAGTQGVRDNCPFCRVSGEPCLADLEEVLGLPFRLIGDSRPFLPRHMLATAKTHNGKLAYHGFRDLLWLLNVVFGDSFKANVGTGNQAAHPHMHLFQAKLPVERLRARWITGNRSLRIGLLHNELDLTYLVVEGEHVDDLARGSYWVIRQIERAGLLTCVILAKKRVYIIPQVRKTISPEDPYPSSLAAFLPGGSRPQGLRPRFVGPIEMAGLWLCYARGDFPAARRMYEEMDLQTYHRILRDTGLPLDDPRTQRLLEACRAIWSDATSVISLDDPRAADGDFVGGKAAGLHFLRGLAAEADQSAPTGEDRVSRFRVPHGFVLSTKIFEEIVLTSRNVREKLLDLFRLATRLAQPRQKGARRLNREIAAAAKAVRDAIMSVNVPARLRCRFRSLLRMCGGCVAVRSSASIEDGQTTSAAGLAYTALDVRSPAALVDAVKQVWSSLYNTAFVLDALRRGEQVSEARMAVVLQPMVNATCAGVITSLDSLGRPVLTISASAGPAESLVNGGPAETWLVSPDAAHILERYSTVPDESARPSCLSEADVLALASVARGVREAWQAAGRGRHVDVEFAIDADGLIVLLQCRPLTAVTDTKDVRVQSVNAATTPPGVQRVPLPGGVCAFEGAAAGRLRVLDGGDEQELIRRVQPRDVVVTDRTTCRWNEALFPVAGLITQSGSMVSHPAIHSRERQIPAVVGVPGAVGLLKPYDGQTVTIDSGGKTVFLGEAPIIETVRPVSMWVVLPHPSDDDRQPAANDVEQWRTHGSFREDEDGPWFARPLVPYPPFQLDYYARAFRWYEDALARLPWPGQEDKPAIGRNMVKVRDGILWVKLSRDGSPEHDFFHSLSLEDFEYLVEWRWQVMERASLFLEALTELGSDNFEQVVDSLVHLLGVNSMGYELRTAFEEKFLLAQQRCVSPSFLPLMMRLAAESVDAGRPDLDLECDKARLAVAEKVSADRHAVALLREIDFGSVDVDAAVNAFGAAKPSLFAEVRQLACKCKLNTEDIRELCNVPGWLESIGRIVTSVDPGMKIEKLAALCQPFLLPGASAPDVLEAIRSQSPELYLLIRRRARADTSGAEGPVRTEDILRTVDRLRDISEVEGEKARAVRSAVANYPMLRRTLAVAQSETHFRLNFHHVITRCQRHVARMMLAVARKFPTVFRKADDVFGITADELVAFVQKTEASYAANSCGSEKAILRTRSRLAKAHQPADKTRALVRRNCLVEDLALRGKGL